MSTEKYTNFKNKETFQLFTKLPKKYNIRLACYETSGNYKYKPHKHWCFFTKKFNVEGFIRLRLIV